MRKTYLIILVAILTFDLDSFAHPGRFLFKNTFSRNLYSPVYSSSFHFVKVIRNSPCLSKNKEQAQLIRQNCLPNTQCLNQVQFNLSLDKHPMSQQAVKSFTSSSRLFPNTQVIQPVQDEFVQVSEKARKYGFNSLVHVTDCNLLPAILRSKMLTSGQVASKSNTVLDNVNHFSSFIFLELSLSDNPLLKQQHYIDSCVLYFDLELLDKNSNFHMTNEWIYGWYLSPTFLNQKKVFSAYSHENEKLDQLLQSISNYNSRNEVVYSGTIDLKFLSKIKIPNTRTDLLELIQSHQYPVETYHDPSLDGPDLLLQQASEF